MTARRGGGFTLIELLIGLALFSLVALTLHAAFRLGGRSVEAGETRTAALDDMRVVHQFLRQTIGDSVPVAIERQRRWRLQFDGRADRLEFVGTLPLHVARGGLRRFEIVIAPRGTDRAITLAARTLSEPARGAVAGTPIERTLVEGIEQARFLYYGAKTPRAAPKWHERWSDAASTPTLVRLEVTTSEGAWPPLVVRIESARVRRMRDPRRG